MAQSLSKLYIHLIFHIKTTSPHISDEDLERLLSKNESISHVVEEVKRNSSRWIKTIDARYGRFEWQGGYGAFSVSQSVVDKTLEYIRNQKTHHAKHSFHDEYIGFLKLYGISYDDRYVFTD